MLTTTKNAAKRNRVVSGIDVAVEGRRVFVLIFIKLARGEKTIFGSRLPTFLAFPTGGKAMFFPL